MTIYGKGFHIQVFRRDMKLEKGRQFYKFHNLWWWDEFLWESNIVLPAWVLTPLKILTRNIQNNSRNIINYLTMHIAADSKMFSIRNIYINKRRQSLQHLSSLQYNLVCIPKTMKQDKNEHISITLQQTNRYTMEFYPTIPFM